MNSTKNQVPPVPVVFYDGKCGLCDRSIAFLLASPNASRMRYAPQGGSTFQEFAGRFPEVATQDSIIVWEPAAGRYLTEAAGLTFALQKLGGMRRLLGFAAGLVPKPVANRVYQWIARNRRRFFSHKGMCSILTDEKRALILP